MSEYTADKEFFVNVQTPDWVKHAVFYQIFPDRFRRGAKMQHVRGIQLKPWGSPPTEQGYQGGDLYGVAEKLDYLKDLGINAIYLNPIFSAASNHRYNAYDYMQVDPLLGGNDALRLLLDEAHRRGIKIVLDLVPNHCGRGFWAFHHILENDGNSPYLDWFTIKGFPLHPYPTSRDQNPNYACWWNVVSLPKLNVYNPGVRDYLLNVTRYWLQFGIDGWRLDVAEEIRDDNFWREFRQAAKSVNPEAYIVAEIWHEAAHWLQGDMFDAVMNYQVTAPIYNFFGRYNLNTSWHHPDVNLHPIDGAGFRQDIETLFNRYAWEINYAQMNMLDSHDMPRGLWLLKNNEAAFKLAILAQMTLPGAPCVYYGDEVGLSAGGDPHCREAFPWERAEQGEHPMHAFYKQVISLRHVTPALQTGDFAFLQASGDTVVYRRRLDGKEAIVAFNAGGGKASLALDSERLSAQDYRPAWPAKRSEIHVQDGRLALVLPAQSALVLVSK
jgi:neopullulanase